MFPLQKGGGSQAEHGVAEELQPFMVAPEAG
jgi:hypothetical protein